MQLRKLSSLRSVSRGGRVLVLELSSFLFARVLQKQRAQGQINSSVREADNTSASHSRAFMKSRLLIICDHRTKQLLHVKAAFT